jgi:hypothetical protein
VEMDPESRRMVRYTLGRWWETGALFAAWAGTAGGALFIGETPSFLTLVSAVVFPCLTVLTMSCE